jgi:branched-chain amino acid transport system substrate-binding protein
MLRSMPPRAIRIASVVLTVAILTLFSTGAVADLKTVDKSFLVGIICPLTSSSKSFGIGDLQGATLAINQHNLLGKNKVKVRIINDQSNPDIGVAAVQELQDQGAVAILGPCNSSVARAVLLAGKLGTPMISATATASELTESNHNPWFFRMNVSDRKRIAEFLSALFNPSGDEGDQRPQHLVVFYEKNDAYGEGLVSNTQEWLSKNQSDFLASNFQRVAYTRDLSVEDAENILNGLPKPSLTKTDSVLMLGLAVDALTFVSAIRKLGLNPKIYLPEPEQNIFRVASNQGLDLAAVRVFSVWDPSDTSINSFVPSFKRAFAEEPTFAASLSYDATTIFLWALDGSVGGPSGLPALRARIADKLKTFDPKYLKLALNGDQRLDTGEYTNLKFRGLQFDHTGTLIGWNLSVPPPIVSVSGSVAPVQLPKLSDFLMVVLCGFIGSSLRELNNKNVSGPSQILSSLFRTRILLVDPLIALLVFIASFLGVLGLKPNLITPSAQTPTIYFFAAFVIGLLSGYMGIGVIYALLAKLGVDRPKDPVTTG